MRGRRIVMVLVGAAVVTGLIGPAAGAASTGNATDKEIATAGVLVAGDLPATYTQSARDTSSDAQTLKMASKLAAQSGGTAKADIKKVHDITAGDQAVAYEGPVTITGSGGSTTTLAFGNL